MYFVGYGQVFHDLPFVVLCYIIVLLSLKKVVILTIRKEGTRGLISLTCKGY